MLASFYQEENHQSNIELSCYTAVSADIPGSACIKLPSEYTLYSIVYTPYILISQFMNRAKPSQGK